MGARRRAGSPAGTAKDRALGLLAVRWRSRDELRRRLLHAGFGPEDVEPALDDLAASGLIDDDRFAREMARDQALRRRAGDRAIRAELRRKGVATEVVETALAGVAQDEGERARLFAVQRAARMATEPPEVAYRRLQGALLRRGYPPAVAREAARFALGAALDEAGEVAGEP